jgi:ribonucleotide monophosphatase NagD (HAD superfamily)
VSKLRELGLDGLVVDLDGVVYRGQHALPGAVDAIRKLRAAGIALLLCTNNSAPTLEAYRSKLQSMGIDVDAK